VEDCCSLVDDICSAGWQFFDGPAYCSPGESLRCAHSRDSVTTKSSLLAEADWNLQAWAGDYQAATSCAL
jgi:hypothetical protein